MENFFKPVHSASGPDENKQRKHHHHHYPHHHPEPQYHRYTVSDDTDRNTDESHEHRRHHQHGSYHSDTRRRHQTCYNEEDEILYNHDTTGSLSWASSLSSSSSSSLSSSWYTEASTSDPFSLRHAERPLHSLSCSNIPDVHRSFRDDSSEPIVFATIKHGRNGSGQLHGSSQQKGKQVLSSLDRGLSRSEEGLLQGNEGEQSRVPKNGPLYKTSSLTRSLAFSEEDILLGVSGGPKRAVSSSQLPSKGILKNKESHSDIRKAKSMEVLSPRVSKKQDPSGQKQKGVTPEELDRAKANFVQGKLKFSAFLDEITKQVISPSDLIILGVNKDKTTGKSNMPAETPGPVKPQLPPKKHRESSGEEKEQPSKQHSRHNQPAHSSSLKHSESSDPDKLISYAARKHQGSPPPHYYPNSNQNIHHKRNRKEKRPAPLGGPVSEDKYGRCGPHLTDGTSTSPEPIQPKQRHHRKHQTTNSPHTQNFPQPQPQQVHPSSGQRAPSISPPSSAQGQRSGLGSESSSSKSDSSRTRDAPSTATSHSSEQRGCHPLQNTMNTKQRWDMLCDVDQLQALQEENTDLHQNLLQTVICIESLESELQRTRDELSSVKEKYKSLLETHSGTKQANTLLGEHLHIASESLSSERKYLLNRVAHLTSELEEAHRTIAALENINVPCLIRELLEKHFDSAEAKQRFLTTSAPFNHSATSQQAQQQPQSALADEKAHDWLTKSAPGSQKVTAFVPFKQEALPKGTEGQSESSHSPPFSVSDISAAIYKKIAGHYAAKPQPLYSQQQPTLVTIYNDTQSCQQAHGEDTSYGKGEVKVTLLEQDVVDVTSTSAQQILDDFLHQLQAHKEVGGGQEQPAGQEWAGGAEQTGKVAD